eukprot:1885207-Rhodomonas_salina.3
MSMHLRAVHFVRYILCGTVCAGQFERYRVWGRKKGVGGRIRLRASSCAYRPMRITLRAGPRATDLGYSRLVAPYAISVRSTIRYPVPHIA